jgi:type II secretory pathway component GspD/PulD (secretin)
MIGLLSLVALAGGCASTRIVGGSLAIAERPDDMVMEVLPLKYTPARLLAVDVEKLAAAAPKSVGHHVRVYVDERTNSLILTCPRELLSLIKKRIEEEDREKKSVQVVPLQYENAAEIAEWLNELRDAGLRAVNEGRAHGGACAFPEIGREDEFYRSMRSLAEDGSRVEADPRTNSVIVVARNDVDLSRVLELIARLDEDAHHP